MLLALAGTRPEVLKLAPVLRAVKGRGRIGIRLCVSGQQEALPRGILAELGLVPDLDLTTSEDGAAGGLTQSLSRLLSRLDATLGDELPDGVLVQGDTTTALAGALSAFHRKIPVFHVEAGLRTDNPLRPFPEEMNRRLLSRLATRHYAPTEHAKANLLRESVPEDTVLVTGNTVVDALSAFGKRGERAAEELAPRESGKARVLVTLHRRENAETVDGVVAAVRELSTRRDVDILWVTHPNATGRAAAAALGTLPNVRLLPPQAYATFIALVAGSRVVLTDSGGVQEEAPVLGVPVVVLRAETDRPESVLAGNAVLAGNDAGAIVDACGRVLDDPDEQARRSRATSPFGDGQAGPRIAQDLETFFAV